MFFTLQFISSLSKRLDDLFAPNIDFKISHFVCAFAFMPLYKFSFVKTPRKFVIDYVIHVACIDNYIAV